MVEDIDTVGLGAEVKKLRSRRHVATLGGLGTVTPRGKVRPRMRKILIRLDDRTWEIFQRQLNTAEFKAGVRPSYSDHVTWLIHYRERAFRGQRGKYMRRQEEKEPSNQAPGVDAGG